MSQRASLTFVPNKLMQSTLKKIKIRKKKTYLRNQVTRSHLLARLSNIHRIQDPHVTPQAFKIHTVVPPLTCYTSGIQDPHVHPFVMLIVSYMF
jgi:hypothetical protein